MYGKGDFKLNGIFVHFVLEFREVYRNLSLESPFSFSFGEEWGKRAIECWALFQLTLCIRRPNLTFNLAIASDTLSKSKLYETIIVYRSRGSLM